MQTVNNVVSHKLTLLDRAVNQRDIYTVSPKKHVTTFSTITLTISVRLQ